MAISGGMKERKTELGEDEERGRKEEKLNQFVSGINYWEDF